MSAAAATRCGRLTGGRDGDALGWFSGIGRHNRYTLDLDLRCGIPRKPVSRCVPSSLPLTRPPQRLSR
ncbi:hypothetical protein [Streptomyces sp. NPDC051001]|uniref:hypothetical protein n=1 Tax=Streptomyces sp. NPDC051001 TaxID=3155795 RepID=UPI003427212D